MFGVKSMKKIKLIIFLGLIFVLSGCSLLEQNANPLITNTSYTININDRYDVIQSSATTSNFVKDERISEMKIIVEGVDQLNWNDRYVVIKTYDGLYYVHDNETETLLKRDNKNDFLELQRELSITLPLKKKIDFNWRE